MSIASKWTNGSNWRGAIDSWVSEVKKYKYPTASPGTGHYTQVFFKIIN